MAKCNDNYFKRNQDPLHYDYLESNIQFLYQFSLETVQWFCDFFFVISIYVFIKYCLIGECTYIDWRNEYSSGLVLGLVWCFLLHFPTVPRAHDINHTPWLYPSQFCKLAQFRLTWCEERTLLLAAYLPIIRECTNCMKEYKRAYLFF